jgi:hypothetical protein
MTGSLPLISGSGPSIFPVALLAAIGVFFVLVAVVGIFVVLVVANRADADPTGRRPLVVYLFGVSFFTVFAVLFGSFGIVQSVVQLIGTNANNGGGFSVAANPIHPVGDAVARGATLSGIILGVALIVLVPHLARGLALSGRADPRVGPLGRVAQSYVSAVSFVAVVVAVIAVAFALYEVVRIVAPGVYQVAGTRTETLRPLLSSAYLALAAGVLLWLHLRLVPPEIRRGRARGRPAPAPVPNLASSPGPVAPPPAPPLAPQAPPPPPPIQPAPPASPPPPTPLNPPLYNPPPAAPPYPDGGTPRASPPPPYSPPSST